MSCPRAIRRRGPAGPLRCAKVFIAELLAFAVELVGEPLQKQHAEDELLELRGVHLATQDIGSLQEEGLKLARVIFSCFIFGLFSSFRLSVSHLWLFVHLPNQAHQIGHFFHP